MGYSPRVKAKEKVDTTRLIFVIDKTNISGLGDAYIFLSKFDRNLLSLSCVIKSINIA